MSARHSASQRRLIWPPEPGTFALRLVKNGWRTPCRIVIDDDNRWYAEVDECVLQAYTDPALAPMVDTIWHGGERIKENDYRWRIALKAHARKFQPEHPCLHPYAAIDCRLLTPLTS